MKTNEKGFTLIELVMVIVILGILAAVAIPQFINLSSQAETAAEEGVVGALRSGIYVHSVNQMATAGTASYPVNPFNSLGQVPTTYNSLAGIPTENDEWSFVWAAGGGTVYHQPRAGGTDESWTYNSTTGILE